jgi:hypothetical protein
VVVFQRHSEVGGVRDQHIRIARLAQCEAALERLSTQLAQAGANTRIAVAVFGLILDVPLAHAHLLGEFAPCVHQIQQRNEPQHKRHLQRHTRQVVQQGAQITDWRQRRETIELAQQSLECQHRNQAQQRELDECSCGIEEHPHREQPFEPVDWIDAIEVHLDRIEREHGSRLHHVADHRSQHDRREERGRQHEYRAQRAFGQRPQSGSRWVHPSCLDEYRLIEAELGRHRTEPAPCQVDRSHRKDDCADDVRAFRGLSSLSGALQLVGRCRLVAIQVLLCHQRPHCGGADTKISSQVVAMPA